ncbi:hypothetical protein [Micromonospora sp. NPDC049301]|uniref:hypothetical protein n=1 Tax=Micromonospora sp. NPDC049301 TaxID=3155723 RepID=UPI00342ED5E5
MSTDAVDDLRAAWLARISTTDRAGAQLHGAGPPGRRLPWQDAVTECWRALSLVYAGVAASREPAIWAGPGGPNDTERDEILAVAQSAGTRAQSDGATVAAQDAGQQAGQQG